MNNVTAKISCLSLFLLFGAIVCNNPILFGVALILGHANHYLILSIDSNPFSNITFLFNHQTININLDKLPVNKEFHKNYIAGLLLGCNSLSIEVKGNLYESPESSYIILKGDTTEIDDYFLQGLTIGYTIDQNHIPDFITYEK